MLSPVFADDRELAHRGMVLRDARPIPKCHPARPIGSKGLCGPCYEAQLLPPAPPVQPEPLLPPTPAIAIDLRATAPTGPPTPAELAAFLAIVEHSRPTVAGRAMCLSGSTIRNQLTTLYRRIGARSRAHAAWLLSRELGERYVLPCDTPRRRRVA